MEIRFGRCRRGIPLGGETVSGGVGGVGSTGVGRKHPQGHECSAQMEGHELGGGRFVMVGIELKTVERNRLGCLGTNSVVGSLLVCSRTVGFCLC